MSPTDAPLDTISWYPPAQGIRNSPPLLTKAAYSYKNNASRKIENAQRLTTECWHTSKNTAGGSVGLGTRRLTALGPQLQWQLIFWLTQLPYILEMRVNASLLSLIENSERKWPRQPLGKKSVAKCPGHLSLHTRQADGTCQWVRCSHYQCMDLGDELLNAGRCFLAWVNFLP
jgi:hypothetical protein